MLLIEQVDRLSRLTAADWQKLTPILTWGKTSETLQAYDDALSAKRKKLKPNEFICGICDRISEKTEPCYGTPPMQTGT